jgi:peptide/nickel transport system permease protein
MVFIAFFGYQAHPNIGDWKLPIPIVTFILILIVLLIFVGRRRDRPLKQIFTTEDQGIYLYGSIIGGIIVVSILLLFTTDGYVHLWFPISGSRTPGIEEEADVLLFYQDVLHHAFLPILVLTIYGILSYGWFMRGNIIGALTEDYVQTAVSKGLSENQVLYGHCMRNAILPVVTDIGMSFGSIIGGSILVEQVFGYPGTGLLLYDALLSHDYNVVQGAFIIIAALTLLGLLIAEILYGIIDPRVRTE